MSARIRERLAAGSVLGEGPTGTAGTWQLPIGWVRLHALWHRPHPELRGHVMCELVLPAGVPVYWRRTANKPACPDCNAIRSAALAEMRARDDQRARTAADKPIRRPGSQSSRIHIVRGGLPTLGRGR